MTKNEFNIGDKVVTKQYYDIDVNGYSTTIPIGEEGVIEDIYADELLVSFGNYGISLIRPISEFEPIQPLARRTAFLTRLQSLLREFDAFLVAHKTDMPVSLYFNDNEDDIPSASIGKEINKGCGVVITADNIMDFDKEGVCR